jgi:outer membrane lipoprotein SlyB
MVKSLMIGGIALAAITAAPLAASAQAYGYGTPYNSACESQNRDNKTAGTVIGAIVGAAAGGAIGNNVGDNDSRWHYNRYDRRGRYGRHGRRGYWDKGNNDGEVVAGALLGAIVGGMAGNAMASSNATPCQVATPNGGSYRADYGAYPLYRIGIFRRLDPANDGRPLWQAAGPAHASARDSARTGQLPLFLSELSGNPCAARVGAGPST